ncbi:MAG TPA: hypothetical protein DCY94_04760, partial [Firmicutes bacterium]|nr:hypothetical protein [Bacillota bacterium]
TKKFKIINTGTLEASLSLDWKNLVNTYLNRSLSYNLSYAENESGPYTEIIPETNMPTSGNPIRQAVASELSVPAGDTYYYNLTITLNDLPDLEQDDDLEASFSTEFDVGEPSRYRYYRLTVDPNGGELSGVEREYLLKNKETITIDSNPTKVGYTFAGWRVQGTSSDFTGNTFTMGISDTYLIAQYIPNTYTLTINPNGGTYTGSTTIDIGYQTPTSISTPTREGYTFTGWTSEDGRIENDKFILTSAKDATLTATWTKNNYKYIVYHNKMNLDGSTYTLVSADTDEGEAEYESIINPGVKTYTGFASPGVKSLTIAHETEYPPVLNKVDYNYDRNKYTLTIDPNGGSYNGSTSNSTIEMFYEESKEFATSGSTQETLNALGVTPKAGNPTFANAATTDETVDGLYSMADDYGTSYYYRGAVENNYVKFGGFFWRIIRINGDGSVRMIYDGTQAWPNGNGSSSFASSGVNRFTHTGKAWNANYDDAKYVGWMFGGTNGSASTSKEQAQQSDSDSNLKEITDSWYKTNIADKGLSKYVSDEIFCNDRSTPGSSATGWSSDTGLGFGTNATAYGPTARTNVWNTDASKVQPTFVCPEKNDAFTVDDTTKGNGSLSYPVGLITADEIVAAGSGKYGIANYNYYLYKSSSYWYWSLSPRYISAGGHARVFLVYMDGSLDNDGVDNADGAVAPVINIAPEYAKTLVGEGTMTKPYELPTDTSSDSIMEPTKEGYTFTGWTKTSGNGTLTSSSFTMGEGGATIQANYSPKEYQITFNANGGSTTTASKTVSYASEYGELPTPAYEGYKFLGWFTASSGGTQVLSSTIYSITDNQTLYAHWQVAAGTEATLGALKVTPKSGTPTFANAATTDEGVYSMEDDYGTSYYYRGAVENNYVKFGGFYWRIIRINGDGSLRMIYDGTQAWPNGNGAVPFTTSGSNRFTYTKKAWNANYNDAKYVGWMFGGNDGSASTSLNQAQKNTTDSDLKEQWVDPWYKTNIVDKGFSKYVSDEIFCNDRSTPGQSATGWSSDTGLGYGSNATAYGAVAREGWNGTAKYDTPSPQFTCQQKNDAFTVSDTTKGNGALTYPVGLITADEIVAAGSGNGNNRHYYLYKSSSYRCWSLSPSIMEINNHAYVFVIAAGGNLGHFDVTGTDISVAPVINIAPEYAATMTGEGSTTSPYKIPGVE